jgi:hypothetical protein
MTPRQATLFLQIYQYNARFPQGPFLVDGPRRMKLAKEMCAAGWLDDHGPIGLGEPWGNAYRVNDAGINEYNKQFAKGETADV